MTQEVKSLLGKHKDPSSDLQQLHKVKCMSACDPVLEAGGAGTEDPWDLLAN